MVPVYDGQMHVYKMGSGKETIILLPGMGIALPSADFGPLMRQLSEKYTVVCVEYFGVGFSSQTQRTRTCENYVEEIRTALKSSGIKAPYILMPHSISSVYSETMLQNIQMRCKPSYLLTVPRLHISERICLVS